MNKDWSRVISIFSILSIIIMGGAFLISSLPVDRFFDLDKTSFNAAVFWIILIDFAPCVLGSIWLIINHYKKADLQPETESEKKRRITLIKLMLLSMAIMLLNHLFFHSKN